MPSAGIFRTFGSSTVLSLSVPDSASLGPLNLCLDFIPLRIQNSYYLAHFTDEELSLTGKELVLLHSR